MRFENLLDEYNVEYYAEGGHHHARAGWLQLDCPRCSPGSGRFRLGFNLHGIYFNCWVCGRIPVPEAVSGLLGVHWKQVRDQFKEIKTLERDTWRTDEGQGRLIIPDRVGELEAAHLEYLRERGFDPDVLQEIWHIRGIGICTDYPWRIFIPIRYRGKTVSWTTRSIDPHSELRYLSAPDGHERIPRQRLLYGEDYCTRTIIVHEGPTDAWAVGPGSTATLGISYTQEQVQRIARYPKRIICFDSEPDAQERADVICRELKYYPGETINVALDAPDAGSAPEKELKILRGML